ncbi:E3 ubiquitin-protein ligase ubr3-like [Crassostrea angulata]|uniref:E3 ubiquitin-protein ligase ubr3-like n=1 Tax=Magallana angulata TaxID=2784310 RepID=UPI0022B1E3EE|nr:E3 ubiquitin-protein ligase ubr3-like [Crassostrea angulata]
MAAPSEVTALLKRGKRSVASLFKGEWSRRNGSPKAFKEFLDYLFDPRRKSIEDVDTIDWCRWIVAGGATFDEFSAAVKQYDNAVTCGLVWTKNFVAYRCRTCGISPCMSLCYECFHSGNHEGHDFNMFRSQAGGACDCGDINVLNKSGFCSRHGPDRKNLNMTPPTDLLAIAEALMPRVILRLIHHFRDNCKPMAYRDTFSLAMNDAEHFLSFMHSLSDMGAAMRRVMGLALTNTTMYKYLTEVEELPDYSNSYFVESQKNYLVELNSLSVPKGFEDFDNLPGLSQELHHSCLLDELVFWMVKYEFPEKLVTLLLSLLPDEHYKEAFTKAFVKHYSRISLVLVKGLKRTEIGNRVVHISVQLFSNEGLACQMVQEYNLLYTLIISLTHMIENTLLESSLEDFRLNFHMVVDCTNDIMKEHIYWPIVSDFINLLAHKKVAHKFLSDSKLVVMWLDLLSYFQGMNLNHRELSQHVEFESETYYAAFSAELEIASAPMWSLLSHCKTPDSKEHVLNMIKVCTDALQDWFDAINCKESTKPNAYQLTFHLPLHRYLATFIETGITYHSMTLDDLPLTDKMLKMTFTHLLQIQVCLAEIYTSMWVRNGIQIKGQAMTYIQCHFCYSMGDADLYLMQLCACKFDPDYFVKTVLERFHVENWLTYGSTPINTSFKLEPEQQIAMVDAVLQLFTTLLGVRTYLGIGDKELTRFEMATILCFGDKPYSQIMDSMPERSGITGQKELFEPTLSEIADYKAPNLESSGGLQQGTYTPKGFVWEREFDPVHVSLRALYKKDIQTALDRYTEHIRQSGKYKSKTPPWPPFRPPGKISGAYKDLHRLLHCKTMHAFLFTVLYKFMKESSIPDSVLYNTVHLLDLAMTLPSPDTCRKFKSFCGSVTDVDYHDWFCGTSIHQNVREVVREVLIPVMVEDFLPTSLSSLEEMFQMAPSAMMNTAGPITAAHSGALPTGLVPVPVSSHHHRVAQKSHQTAAKSDSVPKYENRGVSTENAQKLCVPINECIISMLIKIHAKLMGQSCSYVPLSQSKRQISDSVIGDGPFFVCKLLDKMSRSSTDCARAIEDVYTSLNPKEVSGAGKKRDTAKDEERRRKARERQQKLMNKFANKQKAFMQQNPQAASDDENDIISDLSATEIPQEVSGSVQAQEYDCVICGTTSASTADKTMGLVVLLQPSSVLGHRLQENDVISLPLKKDQKVYPHVSCASVQRQQLKTMFEHFEESSCQLSVNIGWEGGVVVHTCGHYLHLDCHSSYLLSLRTQEMTGNLAVNKGEYWCPLCRQLANSVIPIPPEEDQFTIKRPLSSDPKQLIKDVADMMVSRPITPRSPNLTKVMGSVMEDLTNATYGKFKTYTSSQTSESVLLFVCSVARTNLEMELVNRGNMLTKSSSQSGKRCFLPLYHVLSMHSKILTTKPYTDLWSHMTGLCCSVQTDSVSLYHKDVPLLLKDPVSLLIQILLTLPSTMEKEHFECVLQVLYNVVYIKAIAATSCTFTSEEREAWRKKGRHSQLTTLEGMMSHVITRLQLSRVYDDIDMDKDIPAICQSVWSPQSVDMAIQDIFLPFLRVAALLKYHLFNVEFPSQMSSDCEFLHLCTYLRILGTQPATSDGQNTCSARVCWTTEEPLNLTRAWCTDLANAANQEPVDFKSLLMSTNTWSAPSLIELPNQYYQIFQSYSQRTCVTCGEVPNDPAICLVCANYTCFRQNCCTQQGVSECVHHSIQCGAGTSMYLLINSTIVVVIRGPRATLWGSVYLDDHGEEDRDLKRGKPLYLSKERYRLLQHQWLTHSFDRSCQRWIWHQDRL